MTADAKGIVGAGRRGVDVEALGAFGAAPGTVGTLVGEQELYAALDGAVISAGLGGVMGAGLGPLVASGEILTSLLVVVAESAAVAVALSSVAAFDADAIAAITSVAKRRRIR